MPSLDDDEVDLSQLAPGSLRTEPVDSTQLAVRRFELTGVAGPAAAVNWASTGATCAIGSHAGNDLVVDDPSISRSHCELRVERGQVRLFDLDSTNSTALDAHDASQPYQQARDRVLPEFGRRCGEQLLEAHQGNVSAAARASGIDRTYLHRLMRRYGLR